MCPYHEDVINVSLINSRLKWNGRKKISTNSMKKIAYAGAILVPIAVPMVCKWYLSLKLSVLYLRLKSIKIGISVAMSG